MKPEKKLWVIITLCIMMFSLNGIAQSWLPLGNGVSGRVQATYTDSSKYFYVSFTSDTILNFPNDTVAKINVAKWDGNSWMWLPSLLTNFHSVNVNSICVYNNELYLSGYFDSIIGVANTKGLAKFNGSVWSGVNCDIGSRIYKMQVYQNKLFIAGDFQKINGATCNNLAYWDGTNWNVVGTVGKEGVNFKISDLLIFNNKLFFCGLFTRVGNITKNSALGAWDGTNWYAFQDTILSEIHFLSTFQNSILAYGYKFSIYKGTALFDGVKWSDISTIFQNMYLPWQSKSFPGTEYKNQFWMSGGFILKSDPKTYNFVIWDGTKWYPYLGIDLKGDQVITGFSSFNNKLLAYGEFDSLNGTYFNNIAYFNSNVGKIGGKVFYDANGNCIKENNEYGIASHLIEINPGKHYSCTDLKGKYEVMIDTGNTTINLVKNNGTYKYWRLTACNPTSYLLYVTDNIIDTINNFAYEPIPNIEDSRVFITARLGFRARPGRTEAYTLVYENIGTTDITGTVNLNLDSRVNLQTSVPAYTTYTHPNASWNYINLQPAERRIINLTIKIDTSLAINDTINFKSSIMPTTGDSDISNNYDSLKQRIVTSVDPNDKQCSPEGNILPITSKIDYLIRFQNTGNHVAYRVRVVDTITENLPLPKILLKSASHPYELEVKDNVLTWTFNDIMLPDSTSDEPKSHGYISYTAFIKPGLAIGTKITNKAFIYFDYQPAVATRSTLNIITKPDDIEEPIFFGNNDYKIYPNPASGKISIIYQGKNQKYELILFNSIGQMKISLNLNAGEITELDLSDFPNGLYFIRNMNGGSACKIIVSH